MDQQKQNTTEEGVLNTPLEEEKTLKELEQEAYFNKSFKQLEKEGVF